MMEVRSPLQLKVRHPPLTVAVTRFAGNEDTSTVFVFDGMIVNIVVSLIWTLVTLPLP